MSWQLITICAAGLASAGFLIETIWTHRHDIATALIGPDHGPEL